MSSGLNIAGFCMFYLKAAMYRLKSIPLKPDDIKEFWAEVKVDLMITSSVLHHPLVKQSQAFILNLFQNLICGQERSSRIDVKLCKLCGKTGH